MEEKTDNHPETPSAKKVLQQPGSVKISLNVLIIILFIIVLYFSYAFFVHYSDPQKSTLESVSSATSRVIQLDVLNGCGAKGVAAKITGYLRSRGFDVVEMKNYKSSHIPQTMVVDRIGDLANARRVAEALGVSEKRVIQQINPDYFVDVSVIIGEDYAGLSPLH